MIDQESEESEEFEEFEEFEELEELEEFERSEESKGCQRGKGKFDRANWKKSTIRHVLHFISD
jgi:hypothetical protein